MAVGVGAVSISPPQVLAILLGAVGIDSGVAYGDRESTVLTAIRLPRVLATAFVGAAWATAGVAMQGLYRTPLADPALIGVGAGAALGAALGTAAAVGLGAVANIGGSALAAAAAFVIALAAAAVIARVGASAGRSTVATTLLAGVALTAFFGALTALVVATARTPELASVGYWSLGSFSGAVGLDVVVLALVVAPSVAVLAYLGPRLDGLALGPAEAGHLGIEVPRLTLVVTVLFVLLTAVAVAVAGVIAFVALVVPGLLRLWVGPGHRVLFLGAAVLGATLLVLADTLARSLFEPVELPVGVITAIVGAPFFLWLLLRDRGLLAR